MAQASHAHKSCARTAVPKSPLEALQFTDRMSHMIPLLDYLFRTDHAAAQPVPALGLVAEWGRIDHVLERPGGDAKGALSIIDSRLSSNLNLLLFA
jgi:hypothetical protein